MATIRDVARESGVSVATVSYVLNNGPRPVRDSTRQRVLAVMRRLDYHPNAMARGLVRRRLNTLGVLFSSVEAPVANNYAICVLRGIMAAAADQAYNITLFTRMWHDERCSARFGDRRTDGILVVAPLIGSDVVAGLAGRSGLPVVVVSAPSGDPQIPWLDVDNAAGAALAARHLLELGHRRIAMLLGNEDQTSIHQRRDAFVATLAEAGVTIPPAYWLPGSFDPACVYRNARSLLSLPERPTAVFTANDDMALTVLEVARGMGLDVPGDLSVVGFDDSPTSSKTLPPLTTVHHPLAEIGEAATRLLINRVEEQSDGPKEIVFAPELRIRGTTAPPPRPHM